MRSFKMILPDYVQYAIEALEKRGYDAYVVGGCVRDSLMGRQPHDWDITTNAIPDRIREVFSGHPQVLDGLKHGTVTVIFDHKPVEITTYRIDGNYSDGRRPDSIAFTSDLTEDLARRDFTVNACAYGREGLIDPFGGAEDIEARLIRAVGDPECRFSEDALRILRAMRFASELSFSIESKTKEAMLRCMPLLKKISQERIKEELSRTLMGNNVQNVLDEFRDILLFLIPELEPLATAAGQEKCHTDLLSLSVNAIALSERILSLRIALLMLGISKTRCHDFPDSAIGNKASLYTSARSASSQASDTSDRVVENILRRMRFPGQIINQVSVILRYADLSIPPDPVAVKRVLRLTGIESFRLILKAKRAAALSKIRALYKSCQQDGSLQISHTQNDAARLRETEALENILDALIEQGACIFLSDLAVRGDDLIEIGIPKGKMIGETLNRLLDLVVEGKIENKKDALLAEARRIIS
ncbi:MAG: polya polymerase [Clostridiales bacterium]|nr:polya polymerase [Clostridiales bacterium]